MASRGTLTSLSEHHQVQNWGCCMQRETADQPQTPGQVKIGVRAKGSKPRLSKICDPWPTLPIPFLYPTWPMTSTIVTTGSHQDVPSFLTSESHLAAGIWRHKKKILIKGNWTHSFPSTVCRHTLFHFLTLLSMTVILKVSIICVRNKSLKRKILKYGK